MITTHEAKTLKSDFFGAKIINGQVTVVRLLVPFPQTPDGFEKVIQDLRALRKELWPNYIDVNTSHIRFDLGGEKTAGIRYKSKVKWFNDAKGFGFIDRVEPLKGDIFVHFTAIQKEGFRSLAEGESISFEVFNGPHGMTAMNVRPE